MSNFGPIVGLIGAALASLSAFKWMLAGFIIIMLGWGFWTSNASKNALDARALKDLLKSSAQWNLRSSQDSNPLVSLMNSNYAVAYLNVARSLGSDSEIEKFTGVKLDAFIKEIEESQIKSLKKVSNICPSSINGLQLENTGWNSKF